VKDLRELTGVGMMECKRPWWKPQGDIADAEILLRKWGIASAGKSLRAHQQGLIGSYIHHGGPARRAGGGELRIRFRRAHRRFQGTGHSVAMHIARPIRATSAKEDVPADVLDKEKEIAARGPSGRQAREDSRQDRRGRIAKFYEEVCLWTSRS